MLLKGVNHIHSFKIVTILGVVLFACLSFDANAQNTKGDKPAATQKPLFRLPKFKSKKKGGDRANTQDITGRRRISTRSPAARIVNAKKSRSKTKKDSKRNVYPSDGPYVNNPSKYPKEERRAFSGGRKEPRIRSETAQASRHNVFPSSGPYVNNPSKYPKNTERAISNRRTLNQVASFSSKREPPGRKKVITPRTASRSFVTRGRKNVYWGKFSKGEKPITTDISGQPLRAKNYHTPGLGVIPSHEVYKKRTKKPGDQPYSGTFRSGYVTTPNRSKAWRGDVSGHAIRSRPPNVSQSAGKMVFPRKLSAGQKKERAARPMRTVGLVKRSRSGRISNQPIQGKGPGLGGIAIDRDLGKYNGGKKPKGGKVARIKSFNNNGQPIPGKTPGISARFVDIYQGLFKTRKPFKGGGSVSRNGWNNQGQPIIVKTFGLGGYGYSGNQKGQKPLKGGGSISRRGWNNQGQPLIGKTFGLGGYAYSGNLKAQRPLKGGGSINRNGWNNKGQPLIVKTFGLGGYSYSGNLKAQRPLKGGGSINRNGWNNKGQAIIVKSPSGIQSKFVDRYQGFMRGRKTFNTDGSDYAGNKRIWREPKGGGSISGKLWNNSNRPLSAKIYKGSIQNKYLDIYQGFYKAQRPLKGGGTVSGKLWNNKEQPIQGKSVSVTGLKIGGYAGDIKTRKPLKGGGSVSGKLWNNNEHPIEGRSVSPAATKVGGYPGDHKVRRSEKYIRNPNSKEEALKKMRPDKNVYVVNDLLIKTKAREYDHNKHSAKDALKGESNGKNSLKAIEYSSRIKVLWTKTFTPNKPLAGRVPMQKYVHAPNSKKGALMVLRPGKAYGSIKDLQVNVKMAKPQGKNLHPDSKFANSYRDNVKHERTFLMNLKLKWAKLFKKNDTQPAAVKEKVRKPRYDPKEKELWKDLYD